MNSDLTKQLRLLLDDSQSRYQSQPQGPEVSSDLAVLDVLLPGLAMLVEARDAGTNGHCERLAEYAVALGQTIGLASDDLESLRRGGFLHDIGKIGIPDAVLLKPGKLTETEYELMKSHTVIGEALFGDIPSFASVRAIIRHHHERRDGSGYPDGLAGDAIPLVAQIVSIVDAFDAMTSARPYRAALPLAVACDELLRDVQRGALNRELVDTFLSLVRRNQHRATHVTIPRRALAVRTKLQGAA